MHVVIGIASGQLSLVTTTLYLGKYTVTDYLIMFPVTFPD